MPFIPFLLTKLTGLGLSDRLAKIILIATAVALAFAVFVGSKAIYDNRIISHAVVQANVKQLQKEAPANDKAAETRASDTIKIIVRSQERQHAIEKQADQTPTDADIALNCRRLSEAGYDTASFPSCAGH